MSIRFAVAAVVIPLVATLLLIPSCTVEMPSGSEKASAEEKKKSSAEPIVLVEVEDLERGEIVDSITLSGDLLSEHEIDLTSRVSSRVAEVAVRPGDTIRKDQLILALEDEELEILARQDEYAFKEAEEKARSAGLEHTEALKSENLKRISAEKVAKEYARIEKLLGVGPNDALSEEEVETKKFARDEAELAHEMAKLASQRSEIAAKLAKIAVDQAKARWDRSKLELSRCRITSPIDGDISMLDLRPGEMVQSGTVVAGVVNTQALYTEVGVPQRRLPSLRRGQKVEITAETCPGQIFQGTLAAIYPTVDPREGSVKVRISVVDPARILRPGIYVSARIVLDVRPDALLVPKRARLFENDESVVFVVRDGEAKRIPITTGLQTADVLEVLQLPEGLANGAGSGARLLDGDRIVVRGHTKLKDGSRVEIHSAAPDGVAGSDELTKQGGETEDAGKAPEESTAGDGSPKEDDGEEG